MFRHTQVAPLNRSSFRLRGFHALWPYFPIRSAINHNQFVGTPITPPRHCYRDGLGFSPFARHYWGNRVYFLFLQVLRCFSSLRSLPASPDNAIACIGLPHSDICGSQGICPSPQLFAAYHVLLRLREPRHPPYALFSLRYAFKASLSGKVFIWFRLFLLSKIPAAL